jgi:tetratricopeptide (TPR) repeat protein
VSTVVGERLSLLEGAGLIELAAIEPEIEYLFRHVLVQEAAYESLLKQERRELHARVGATLERLYPDRLDELSGLLAMHFEQAGDAERARHYLIEAGEHAHRRHAAREAFGFFERALRLVPDDGSAETRRLRARVGLRMQEAGTNFIPTDSAVAQLADVRADAEAAGDDRTLGEALLLTALALIWRGDRVTGGGELDDALRQAQEIGERLGDAGLRAVPKAFIGQAILNAGQLREGTALLAEAVPGIEAAGRLREASIFAGTLADGLARIGDFAAADTWAARSLELAEASGDPDARLDADLIFSGIEALRGNVTEAIRYAQQAVEQADRVDNKGCGLVGRFLIGEQFLRLGQASDAISPLAQGSGMAEYCVLSPSIVARGRALLASAHLQSGEGAEHLDAFDGALEAAQAVGDPIAEGEVLRERALARAEASEPDWTSIGADFAASIDIFERLEARPHLARTLLDQGRVLLRAGQSSEGRELIERAAQLFDRMGVPTEAERIRALAA